MLRIGFLFHGSADWLGGVNYLWNLLYAIGRHESRALQPVLLSPPGADLFALDQVPGVEVVRDEARPPHRYDWLRRTGERRVLGRDNAVQRACERARLDLVSHSGTYGWRFALPTVAWLADFQHRRMPQFFTKKDLVLRAYLDASQLAEATTTVLSSAAAQRDCQRYYGPLARRTEVLRFVSQPRQDPAQLPSRETVRARHELPERFFFLPNQFWRHKNHAVVIEALAELAARNVRPAIVLTGKANDYRAPGHYQSVMNKVAARGLASQFRHLGLVPMEEVGALMRDAVAVINPSYFEGWSSTVEEARSFGKATLLSDIDVHREQDPPGAVYFPPDDPAALARALEAMWSGRADDEDDARMCAAAAELPSRTAAFAARYRAIVEAAVRSA